MKKNVVSIMLIALIAIGSYVNHSSKSLNNSFDCYLSECEALAGCEIYNSKMELIVNCVGEGGVCYQVTDNLYCDGVKVTK